MNVIHCATVRVGVLVERTDSKWRPFEYRMFYCRQCDKGNELLCPVSEWAQQEVSYMPSHGFDRVFRRMKVGERRRYWLHVRMTATKDYWGECDTDLEVLKMKRAK